MREYTDEELVKYHDLCIFNKKLLEKSEVCGCFFCLNIYDYGEITHWIYEDGLNEKTALCPVSSIDAVIGGKKKYDYQSTSQANEKILV